MNSLWLIIGAMAAFAVAYRYYSAFLAAKVAMLDDSRPTPAHRLRDGVDYHPTRRLVLFGHHFAAIAGPGPLVGPVLAAQWGFLPGYIWIVIGACLAGAVHDFIILWASVREDGLSLPKIARRQLGPVSGLTASIATLFIIICTLASVGVVVVNALGESSWGVFTIIVTIPAALVTGFWMNKLRPGKVAEASVVGVTIVLAGVFFGRPFAESSWGHLLLFSYKQLSVMLAVYACIASILPVWLLLVPRDYLSSYMKIGVMVVLAVGIFARAPNPENAGHDAVHRWGRPRHFRSGLAVRLHRHHVRRDFRFPFADCLGHDAEDGKQGIRYSCAWLRGDDCRGIRGAHGADSGVRTATGRLFRDQRRAGQTAGLSAAGRSTVSLGFGAEEPEAVGGRDEGETVGPCRWRGDIGGGHGGHLLEASRA